MNGASLCNSVLLHSHSLSRYHSSCFFSSSSSSSSSVYLNSPSFITYRIRQSFREVVEKRSNGFCLFSVNKRRSDNSKLIESENSIDDDEEEEEEEDDEDWGEFDEEGEGDEDEDEGEFLPMDKMKKWLEKRPRGFGAGKKYETSIEDKLLEEIEQSWKAQAANLNKLKNDPLKSQQLKRDDNLIKETQIGFRVRVTNLPKKKNVHRDLKAAFKEVSGVLSITPAVIGNKKTKDPICKGFALVDFKSEIDANRFVELFNGQRLGFGKVLKQIKCQVVEFTSNESESKEVYFDNGFQVQKLPYSGLEAVSNADVVEEEEEEKDAFLDSGEDSDVEVDETEVEEDEQNPISSSSMEAPIELKGDSKPGLRSQKQVVKLETREPEESETPLFSFQVNKSEEAVTETQLDEADVEEAAEEIFEPLKSSVSSPSEEKRIDRIRRLEEKLLGKEKLLSGGADSDQPEAKSARVEEKKKEKKKKKKKILVKGQAKKGSKIEIPGSSKRLKVKEKALLTGVLVKYAANAVSTSNDK